MANQNYSTAEATINAITTGTITTGQLAALQAIAVAAIPAMLALQQTGTQNIHPAIAALAVTVRTECINVFGGNVIG